MQVELQPNFADKNKSWLLTEIFIMAKHDGMQKGLLRRSKMIIEENGKAREEEKKNWD